MPSEDEVDLFLDQPMKGHRISSLFHQLTICIFLSSSSCLTLCCTIRWQIIDGFFSGFSGGGAREAMIDKVRRLRRLICIIFQINYNRVKEQSTYLLPPAILSSNMNLIIEIHKSVSNHFSGLVDWRYTNNKYNNFKLVQNKFNYD